MLCTWGQYGCWLVSSSMCQCWLRKTGKQSLIRCIQESNLGQSFTVQHISQPDTNFCHACTWLTDHPASSAWLLRKVSWELKTSKMHYLWWLFVLLCPSLFKGIEITIYTWMEIWSLFQDNSDKCCTVPVNSELEISWAICNSCTVGIIKFETRKPRSPPRLSLPIEKKRFVPVSILNLICSKYKDVHGIRHHIASVHSHQQFAYNIYVYNHDNLFI